MARDELVPSACAQPLLDEVEASAPGIAAVAGGLATFLVSRMTGVTACSPSAHMVLMLLRYRSGTSCFRLSAAPPSSLSLSRPPSPPPSPTRPPRSVPQPTAAPPPFLPHSGYPGCPRPLCPAGRVLHRDGTALRSDERLGSGLGLCGLCPGHFNGTWKGMIDHRNLGVIDGPDCMAQHRLCLHACGCG